MISRGLADAELVVDAFLHSGIVAAEAALAFLTVAIVSTDHRISQGIDVDGWLGGVSSGELLVDALLHGRVVSSQSALAFLTVAVLASDYRVGEGVDIGGGLGRGRCGPCRCCGGAGLVPLMRSYQYWARAM